MSLRRTEPRAVPYSWWKSAPKGNTAKYLIVAHQTAGGKALRDEVERRSRLDAAAEFVLLVPATRIQHLFTWTEGESTAVARARAQEAAQLLRDSGIRLTAERVGDPDPFLAVARELREDPDYDGVVLSTFPPGISRWLRLDLPSRLERQLEIPVTHVVVEPEAAH